MQRLTVDLNGPVHYAEWGGDGPPFVLVHGLGGSLANWMSVAPGLARTGRVLALDLPGFGRSPPAGRSMSIPSQVATVAAFLERVAGGPVTLVGNSMGGLVSGVLSAQRPALVARLVLVDPALPRVAGVPVDRAVALAFLGYMMPGLGRLVVRSRNRWTPRRFLDEMLALCGVETERLPREVLDAMLAVVEYRRTTDWADRSFLKAARAVVGWTALRPERLRATLTSVASPTLLIHGDRDRLVSVGAARDIARRCPSWDVEIMEGVGHVPQLQVPDRFLDVVTRWRESVASR
jgi:pimeloyl-ACP methyl ester carboxylesterase